MADDAQYQSLYRKYRPQGPLEVLGQEHVVRALMGGVRENRLAHAFLFCGPRGTGKTSTARILAKMVNCENGPTAEPCDTCEQCVLIREGSHLDVMEIDAASHGGVEDARELREKAPTAPVIGREKVYIIDEAQRLSREAFDALLKVFEEPPPGVRFVLATTEPHKMPATIIGRCQRFDFRRVPLETLTAHLQAVATNEGVTITPEAAEAIARHTEGSVRDALSLLDQAGLLGGGSIGSAELASLLGQPPLEVQAAIADAVALGDAREVFNVVNGLVQEGQDLRHVTAEALSHFRNLLIVHAAPDQMDLLDVTEDEHERLRTQAGKFSPNEITRIIGLLLVAQTDMRWTTSPRLTLELALIRAAMPETQLDQQALTSRIERLERRSGVEDGDPVPAPTAAPVVAAPPAAAPAAPPPPAAPKAKPAAKKAPAPEPVAVPADAPASAPLPTAMPAKAGDVDMIRRSWPTLIQHLRTQRKMILATNLESVTPVSFDGDTLELMFPPGRDFGIKKVADKEAELRDALQELFGISPRIVCKSRTQDGANEASGSDEEDDGPSSDAEAIARVQAALGAQIAPDLEGA